MIITDRFVFLHLPKTGGTFVEQVLERIHRARGDRIREWNVPPGRRSLIRNGLLSFACQLARRGRGRTFIRVMHRRGGAWSPHGTLAQIPWEHRRKPLLGVLRNPYDWYVSNFEFKWWSRNPAAPRPELAADPDLSFEAYVRLCNPPGPDGRPGCLTRRVLKFYFSRPERVDLDEAALAAGRFRAGLHPRFHPLLQDELNGQLRDFLLAHGYGEEETAFLPAEGRILPPGSTRGLSQKWEHYYTPALKAEVRRLERLLFAMAPRWDA